MTPDEVMREVTECVRDAIHDTPSECLEDAPEDVYTDLACRLMLRLSRKNIALMPSGRLERIEREQAASAKRIFNIFTEWMTAHPDYGYMTAREAPGKFGVTVISKTGVHAYFQGESIQDAYAQAAQTISFNGGSL